MRRNQTMPSILCAMLLGCGGGGTGTEGPAGPKGDIGPAGAAGTTGPAGLAGAKGDPGATGPTGPVGATGATGVAGPAGQMGLMGATGAQGIQGIQGIQGMVGTFDPTKVVGNQTTQQAATSFNISGSGTASQLNIRKDVNGGLGPVLTMVNGLGGTNAGAAIDMSGYDPGVNAPTLRLQSFDDGNSSSHLGFYFKTPGAATNPLVERVRFFNLGGVQIDRANSNTGALDATAAGAGLTFGAGSGEGIASARSGTGGNVDGLDFYTNFLRRLWIDNAGLVHTAHQIKSPQTFQTGTITLAAAGVTTVNFPTQFDTSGGPIFLHPVVNFALICSSATGANRSGFTFSCYKVDGSVYNNTATIVDWIALQP